MKIKILMMLKSNICSYIVVYCDDTLGGITATLLIQTLHYQYFLKFKFTFFLLEAENTINHYLVLLFTHIVMFVEINFKILKQFVKNNLSQMSLDLWNFLEGLA